MNKNRTKITKTLISRVIKIKKLVLNFILIYFNYSVLQLNLTQNLLQVLIINNIYLFYYYKL